MSMTVLGVQKTLSAFLKVAGRSAVAAEAAKLAVAEEVATHARTEHPWHNVTGETEASIQVDSEGVSSAGASQFLEFGTSKMAARPFMRPAAEAATGNDAVIAVHHVIG